MDKVFLGRHLTEDSWRVRYEIAKRDPRVFAVCVGIFALVVLVILIVA
jgi:hypothetical protein